MPFSRSGRLPRDGGNPPFAETGTQDAIYSNSKSARHIDGKPRSVDWGGSRNRADRTSDGLTLAQVEGIRAAAQSAMRVGVPLNAHVTIHWERLGVPDSTAAAATGAFLTRVRDWLRKQGLPFAYAYARENGQGKGSHVHILAHLPAGADWAPHRSRRWLRAIAGGFYQAGRSSLTARWHAGRAGDASGRVRAQSYARCGVRDQGSFASRRGGAGAGAASLWRCRHRKAGRVERELGSAGAHGLGGLNVRKWWLADVWVDTEACGFPPSIAPTRPTRRMRHHAR
jgi:hypothetical protein